MHFETPNLEEDCESIDEAFLAEMEEDNVCTSEWKTWQEAIDHQNFVPPPDCAVFWTGYAEGNKQNAMNYAAKRGKIVLELTPGGKWLEEHKLYDPNSFYSDADADSLWYYVSEKYVKGAVGHVVAFVTRTKNPNSIYQGKEKPHLMENSEVFLSEVLLDATEAGSANSFSSHSEALDNVNAIFTEAKDIWESIATASLFKQNKKKLLKNFKLQNITGRIKSAIEGISEEEFPELKEVLQSLIGIWDSLFNVLGDLDLKKLVEAQIKQGFNVRNHLNKSVTIVDKYEQLKDHYMWLKEYSQFVDYLIFREYRDLQNNQGNDLAKKWKLNVRRYEESAVENILNCSYAPKHEDLLTKEEANILEKVPKMKKVLNALQEIPSLGYTLYANDCQLEEQQKWNYLYEHFLQKQIEFQSCPDDYWREMRYLEEAACLQKRIVEKSYNKAVLCGSTTSWEKVAEDTRLLLLLYDALLDAMGLELPEEKELKEKKFCGEKIFYSERLRAIHSKLALARIKSVWLLVQDVSVVFTSVETKEVAQYLVDCVKNAETLSSTAFENLNVEKGVELKQMAMFAKSLLETDDANSSTELSRASMLREKESEEELKRIMNEIRGIAEDGKCQVAIKRAIQLLKASDRELNPHRSHEFSLLDWKNTLIQGQTLELREITLDVIEEILMEERMRLENNHNTHVRELTEKIEQRLKEIRGDNNNSSLQMQSKSEEIQHIGQEIECEFKEQLVSQLTDIKELENETQEERQILEQEKIIHELTAITPVMEKVPNNEEKLREHEKKLTELKDIHKQNQQERLQNSESVMSSLSVIENEKRLNMLLTGNATESNKLELEFMKADADVRVWLSESSLLSRIAKDSLARAKGFLPTSKTKKTELIFLWDDAIQRGQVALESLNKLKLQLQACAQNTNSPALHSHYKDYLDKVNLQLLEIDLNLWGSLKNNACSTLDREHDETEVLPSDDPLDRFRGSRQEAEDMEQEARASLLSALQNQLPKAWKWLNEVGDEVLSSWKETANKIPNPVPTGLKKIAVMKLKQDIRVVTEHQQYWEEIIKYCLLKLQLFESRTPDAGKTEAILDQLKVVVMSFPTDLTSEEAISWETEKELLTNKIKTMKPNLDSQTLLPVVPNSSPPPLPVPPPPPEISPLVAQLMKAALLEALAKVPEPATNYSFWSIQKTHLQEEIALLHSTIKIMEDIPTVVVNEVIESANPPLRFFTLSALRGRYANLLTLENVLGTGGVDKSIQYEVLSIYELWRSSVIDQSIISIPFLEENIPKSLKAITLLQIILEQIDSSVEGSVHISLVEDKQKISDSINLVRLIQSIWEAELSSSQLIFYVNEVNRDAVDRNEDTWNNILQQAKSTGLAFENVLPLFEICRTARLFSTEMDESDREIFFSLEHLKLQNQIEFWKKKNELLTNNSSSYSKYFVSARPHQFEILNSSRLVWQEGLKMDKGDFWSKKVVPNLQSVYDLWNQRLASAPPNSPEYFSVWFELEKCKRKKLFAEWRSSQKNDISNKILENLKSNCISAIEAAVATRNVDVVTLAIIRESTETYLLLKRAFTDNRYNNEGQYEHEDNEIFQVYCITGGQIFQHCFPSVYRQVFTKEESLIQKFIELVRSKRESTLIEQYPFTFISWKQLEEEAFKALEYANSNPIYYSHWQTARNKIDLVLKRLCIIYGEKCRVQQALHSHNQPMDDDEDFELFDINEGRFYSPCHLPSDYANFEDRITFWICQWRNVEKRIETTYHDCFDSRRLLNKLESLLLENESIQTYIHPEVELISNQDIPEWLMKLRNFISSLKNQIDKRYDENVWKDIAKNVMSYGIPSYDRYFDLVVFSKAGLRPTHPIATIQDQCPFSSPWTAVHRTLIVRCYSSSDPPPPPIKITERPEKDFETYNRLKALWNSQVTKIGEFRNFIHDTAESMIYCINNVQKQISVYKDTPFSYYSDDSLVRLNITTLSNQLTKNEQNPESLLSSFRLLLETFELLELPTKVISRNISSFFYLKETCLPILQKANSLEISFLPKKQESFFGFIQIHSDYLSLLYSLQYQTKIFLQKIMTENRMNDLDEIIFNKLDSFEGRRKSLKTSQSWFRLLQSLLSKKEKNHQDLFLLSLVRESFYYWYQRAIFFEVHSFIDEEDRLVGKVDRWDNSVLFRWFQKNGVDKYLESRRLNEQNILISSIYQEFESFPSKITLVIDHLLHEFLTSSNSQEELELWNNHLRLFSQITYSSIVIICLMSPKANALHSILSWKEQSPLLAPAGYSPAFDSIPAVTSTRYRSKFDRISSWVIHPSCDYDHEAVVMSFLSIYQQEPTIFPPALIPSFLLCLASTFVCKLMGRLYGATVAHADTTGMIQLPISLLLLLANESFHRPEITSSDLQFAEELCAEIDYYSQQDITFSSRSGRHTTDIHATLFGNISDVHRYITTMKERKLRQEHTNQESSSSVTEKEQMIQELIDQCDLFGRHYRIALNEMNQFIQYLDRLYSIHSDCDHSFKKSFPFIYSDLRRHWYCLRSILLGQEPDYEQKEAYEACQKTKEYFRNRLEQEKQEILKEQDEKEEEEESSSPSSSSSPPDVLEWEKKVLRLLLPCGLRLLHNHYNNWISIENNHRDMISFWEKEMERTEIKEAILSTESSSDQSTILSELSSKEKKIQLTRWKLKNAFLRCQFQSHSSRSYYRENENDFWVTHWEKRSYEADRIVKDLLVPFLSELLQSSSSSSSASSLPTHGNRRRNPFDSWDWINNPVDILSIQLKAWRRMYLATKFHDKKGSEAISVWFDQKDSTQQEIKKLKGDQLMRQSIQLLQGKIKS